MKETMKYTKSRVRSRERERERKEMSSTYDISYPDIKQSSPQTKRSNMTNKNMNVLTTVHLRS